MELLLVFKHHVMKIYVARTGKKRNAYRVLVGNTEGKRQVGRLHVGGRIIKKWILKKWNGIVCTGFIWLKMATSGVLLNTNEILGSMEYCEILE
jgi:hypothetical protein